MATTNRHIIPSVCANVCRYVLAVVFVFAGFVKINDVHGTYYKVQDYFLAFGWGRLMRTQWPLSLAVGLAIIEFVLGVYMLFGIRRKFASWGMLAFMLVMTPLTLWLAVGNRILDCGCFGEAIVLDNWATFAKNIVLLACAVVVCIWHRLVRPLVTYRTDWLIEIYAILYAVGTMVYCQRTLPIFDFTPYHEGANLRTVDLDSLDFHLFDFGEGEDLTEQIVADSCYTFLLFSNQLSQANDGAADAFNELYDYAQAHDYNFYGVTASMDDDIEQWRDHTGASYRFLQGDDTALRTVVRANPGLMLLKDGLVVRKWSNYNMPNVDMLDDAPLEQLDWAQPHNPSAGRKMLWVMACFVLPLMLLGTTDRVIKRCRKKKEPKS